MSSSHGANSETLGNSTNSVPATSFDNAATANDADEPQAPSMVPLAPDCKPTRSLAHASEVRSVSARWDNASIHCVLVERSIFAGRRNP